jgi:hypothetical protein
VCKDVCELRFLTYSGLFFESFGCLEIHVILSVLVSIDS